MTKHTLAKLACRILAIYTFIHAFPFLFSLIVVHGMSGLLSLFIGLAMVAVWVVVAFILWFLAEPIARLMVGSEEKEPKVSSSPISYQDWHRLVFSAVGLILIVSSINDLSQTVSILAAQSSTIMGQIPTQIILRWSAAFLGALIKICLGLWLLLDTQGFLNLIKRVRRPSEWREVKDEE